MQNRTGKVVLVLLALAALVAAGAAQARGAEQATLGATIQSKLYADEDRTLTIVSRSTVPAVFSLTAHAGWAVEPRRLTLAPEERASVTVTKTGEDGATLDVRIGSTETPPPGAQASEILLQALLYTTRPWDWSFLLIGAGLIGALLVVGGFGLRRRLRRR